MKISLDDEKRSTIVALLGEFNPAIESLRSLSERDAELESRQTENQTVLFEVRALDNPSDKQIQQLLICRERAVIFQSRAEALRPAILQQKKAVVPLSHQALELFRSTAGAQLFKRGEADLKAFLPARVTSDSHLLFQAWNTGPEKRRITLFLNPTALTSNDDVAEIIEESERLVQLLDNLIQGREVLPESQAVSA
jgi:hypothetical protein